MQSSRGKKLHRTPPLPSMEEIKCQLHHPRKEAEPVPDEPCRNELVTSRDTSGHFRVFASPPSVRTAPFLSPALRILHAILHANCRLFLLFFFLSCFFSFPSVPVWFWSRGTSLASVRSAPASSFTLASLTKFKSFQLQFTGIPSLKPLICSPQRYTSTRTNSDKPDATDKRQTRSQSSFPLPSSLPTPRKNSFCPQREGTGKKKNGAHDRGFSQTYCKGGEKKNARKEVLCKHTRRHSWNNSKKSHQTKLGLKNSAQPVSQRYSAPPNTQVSGCFNPKNRREGVSGVPYPFL